MLGGHLSSQRLIVTAAAAGSKGTAILIATVMAIYIGRVGTPLAVSVVFSVFFLG